MAPSALFDRTPALLTPGLLFMSSLNPSGSAIRSHSTGVHLNYILKTPDGREHHATKATLNHVLETIWAKYGEDVVIDGRAVSGEQGVGRQAPYCDKGMV